MLIEVDDLSLDDEVIIIGTGRSTEDEAPAVDDPAYPEDDFCW